MIKCVTLPLVAARMLTFHRASQAGHNFPDASLSVAVDGDIFEMDDYSASCSPTHFPHRQDGGRAISSWSSVFSFFSTVSISSITTQ